MRQWLSLMAVTVLLSACAILSPPPPQLPPRYNVTPGDEVTVKQNQTIYAVAQENGVSMGEIIVLNNLQPPFKLRPGQTLTLPAKAGAAPPGMTPAPIASSSEIIQTIELDPIKPSAVSEQPLPTMTPPPSSAATKTPTTSTAAEPPVEALNKPAPPPKSVATTFNSKEEQQVVSSGSVTMIWPVKGPVLSTFGTKGQGLNNDGINIGAPKGSPVVAAANGIVVYAGDDMKGFGNLVLIRHEGGWVTAYAHLDRVYVSKDVVVAEGDMVGTVGKSGNVPSPQLHFETRLNGKPVDPKTVIKN